MSSLEIGCLVYFILFVLGFFTFSIQRTTVLIEREFYQSHIGYFLTPQVTSNLGWGRIFMPSWVSLLGSTLFFFKIAVLVFFFTSVGWGYAVGAVVIDFILHAILPIPSKCLKPLFVSRANRTSVGSTVDSIGISDDMMRVINQSRYLN